MASSIDYLEYVLDLLRDIRGITYKKMMGEYVLYKNGIVFGGIYDDRFLINFSHELATPAPPAPEVTHFLSKCPSSEQ